MRMKNWMIGLGVTTVSAIAAVACSSSSSSAPNSPMDSGATTQDATTPEPDTGTTTPEDAGTPDMGITPVVDGGDGGAPGTLYDRLGGHAGIRGAIDAIVSKELADPNIQTYFFNQVATPVPSGHPTKDQIAECFTDLLAKAAGGPEAYPAVVTLDTDAATSATVPADAGSDAGGFACRGDMMAIHAPLKISGGTFDSFIMIAGGVLVSAMGTGPYTYTAADINTIAGVLTGTKTSIVDSNLPADAGAQVYPGADAQ